MPKELSFTLVQNWVSTATGSFQVDTVAKELGIVSQQGRSNLRVYLKRLVDQGVIARIEGRDGLFRPVDGKLVEMNWQNADVTNFMPLVFPFAIHEQAVIYPKSIICTILA
jgi:hypothetical protein